MLTGQAGKVFATLFLCWCFAAQYCAGTVYECYSETAICCDGDMSIIAVEWIGNNTVLVDKNNSITTVAYSENFHSYLNLSVCFATVEQVQLSCCPLDDNYTVITCENYTWSNPLFKGTMPTEEDLNNGGDTTISPMVTTPTKEGLNNGVDTTIIISIVVPTVIVSAIVLTVVIILLYYKCIYKKTGKNQYKPLSGEDDKFSYICQKLSSIPHMWKEVVTQFPKFNLNVEDIRREYHSDEECMKKVIRVVLNDCSDTRWNHVVCVFDKIDQQIAKQICREKCPGQDYDNIVSQPANSSQIETVADSEHITAHVFHDGKGNPKLNVPTVSQSKTVRSQSASQNAIEDTEHERPEASGVDRLTEPVVLDSAPGEAGTAEPVREQQKEKLTRAHRNVLPRSPFTGAEVLVDGIQPKQVVDTSGLRKTHVARTFPSDKDHHDADVLVPFCTPAGGAVPIVSDVGSSTDKLYPLDQTQAEIHETNGQSQLDTNGSHLPGTIMTREEQETAVLRADGPNHSTCVSGANVSDVGSSTDELQPLQGVASPPSLDEEDTTPL